MNSFNPSVDFPLRYFDLTSVCNIGQARLGEKCCVIANVSNIEGSLLLVTDDTGGMFLNLYNADFYETFEVGQRVVFSGVIETYDSQKCINNPLLKPYVEGKYAEVMPVYANNFTIDKTDIEDETFLAIHGFLSKGDLIEARRVLKQKQIAECQKACAEIGSTVALELLKPFANREPYDKNVRLITRFEEGEEAQSIKDAENPLVICPLAYMSSEARNAKVYDIDRVSKVPEISSHPNISVENDDDCTCNFDGVRRRGTVLSRLLRRDVNTGSTFVNSADLIVIEDADRISTLEIDYWLRQAQCDALIVSNSKSPMQLQRLGFLCEPHSQVEVLWHELSFRREGDILGCRNPIFKCLSLVKGIELKGLGIRD